MNPFIFLGGTVGNSKWRDLFTSRLIEAGVPAGRIFNPVVSNWTAESQEKEDAAKRSSNYLLFYICNTEQDGNPLSAYAMVEAVMHLYDQIDSTVVIFDTTGLEGHPLKALSKSEQDLRRRFPDGHIFLNLDEAIAFFASRTEGK
jgi:hypothetical protein